MDQIDHLRKDFFYILGGGYIHDQFVQKIDSYFRDSCRRYVAITLTAPAVSKDGVDSTSTGGPQGQLYRSLGL